MTTMLVHQRADLQLKPEFRKKMNEQHDTNMAMVKVLIAWAGTMFGGVTLSGLVLTATLVYTLLQIFVLVRKLIRGQA